MQGWLQWWKEAFQVRQAFNPFRTIFHFGGFKSIHSPPAVANQDTQLQILKCNWLKYKVWSTVLSLSRIWILSLSGSYMWHCPTLSVYIMLSFLLHVVTCLNSCCMCCIVCYHLRQHSLRGLVLITIQHFTLWLHYNRVCNWMTVTDFERGFKDFF